MEGKTLTLFILSPQPPFPPLAVCPALTPSPRLSPSETVEDSFNAPDNLCEWLRTMEIKQLSVGKAQRVANKKETTADDGKDDRYLPEWLFRLHYYCQVAGPFLSAHIIDS